MSSLWLGHSLYVHHIFSSHSCVAGHCSGVHASWLLQTSHNTYGCANASYVGDVCCVEDRACEEKELVRRQEMKEKGKKLQRIPCNRHGWNSRSCAGVSLGQEERTDLLKESVQGLCRHGNSLIHAELCRQSSSLMLGIGTLSTDSLECSTQCHR